MIAADEPDPRPGEAPRPFCLLGCLALSPRLEAVAGEAVELARNLNARLAFVHAGEDEPATRERLDQAIRAAGHTGPVELLIRPGGPVGVIRRAAREVGADLVLAGSLRRESLMRGIFGSVARKLVRTNTCSVILLTEPDRAGNDFETVVVRIQDMVTADAMMQFATDFCRRAGTKELHVLAGPTDAEMVLLRYEHEARKREAWRAEKLVALHAFLDPYDFGTARVTPTVLATEASGLEVVAYAGEEKADLIIHPAPPRELGFWDRFFSHPAEEVLTRLPCAILFHREGRSELDEDDDD